MKHTVLKKTADLYAKTVLRNCIRPVDELNGLAYWQNRLFASILLYLLPLSLVAIVPGIIISLATGMTFLAVFDFCILLALAFITFHKSLSVTTRKVLFIATVYVTSIVLLFFLGSYGPGLLYLLAVVIITILIFKRQFVYWSVIVNAFICIGFGVAIYFQKIGTAVVIHQTLGSWIAISSNLLLLCVILAALLPTLFKGLQNTIEEQHKLRIQLKIEQRHLEKTLKTVSNKNKELEEFTYMTSHDLQEPLRVISGLLTVLEKNSSAHLDEKSLQYLHLAKDGADRMKSVISNLLEYSLATKKKYAYEEVDLNNILKTFITQNKESLEEKKAHIECQDLPHIKADKLSLQQLFHNLLNNALKYQQKQVQPLIQINYTETQRHWQFTFADNGIGIPKEEIEKVFIAFNRLHDKSEYPGTGIGLAICKKIIKKHRGKIWIESEPNKGSTFYFTISKNLN